jgi:hypothetical protein
LVTVSVIPAAPPDVSRRFRGLPRPQYNLTLWCVTLPFCDRRN